MVGRVMAGVGPACVRSVASQGFGAPCVGLPQRNRGVRGLSGCGLPERVSSGKFCSSSGKGGFFAGKKDGFSIRCSSLPGDGVAAGTPKTVIKSSCSKILRWSEEDVVSSGGVPVVQALPDDAETHSGANGMLVELRETDRPQPIGSGTYGSGNQLSMEMAVNEAQTMTATMYRPKLLWFTKSEDEESRLLDRTFNALLAGAAISYAVTKAVTVDHDVWHGWTVFEVLKYAPLHNWHAYEEFLSANPVLAKMMISGVVYSIGDWIGQCVEGKPVLEFSRVRLLRSGLVGFCLHGSLSHYYYHVCEFLFPFQGWWVVPVKVAFDQTIWSAIWNSIYFITLGLLRFESPVRILKDLRETFFPLLTAGWKLWPFAHLITYGLVPVEQRLLWVDCVEILWVTILSVFANEKAQQRMEISEVETVAVLSSGDAVEQKLPIEDSQ